MNVEESRDDRAARIPDGLIRCNACGSIGYSDDSFCACCGVAIEPFCRGCEPERQPAIANYCTRCGRPIAGERE